MNTEDMVNVGPMLEASFAMMRPLSNTGLKYKFRFDLSRSKRTISPTAAFWMSRRWVK
jgi:hypothetical protein